MRKLLRKTIGQLANLTPGVVYYPQGWPVRINGILRIVAASKDGNQSEMTTAAVSVACAMHEHMKVGDSAEININGVSRGTDELGDFTVTLRRTA